MSYFDESYYLQAKLKQLAAADEKDPSGQPYTEATLRAAVAEAGLSIEEHYKAYGREEKLNPNAYFNEAEYLEAKLNQLQDTGAVDANGQPYTLSSLAAAIESAGLSPAEHYETYGAFETNSKGELLNPSNAFDANAYVQAKLAEMVKAGESIGDKPVDALTPADVLAALKGANLSPVAHYIDYGASEAGTHGVPMVQTVPSEQRVANDPVRATLGENVPGNYNPPTTGALSEAAAAAPVVKPADMGAKAPASVSPPVVVPEKPLPTPADDGYVAPPAGLVDTNEKPVIPPTTSGTGGVTDNWVVVKPDGGADIVKPDGSNGGTLPPGTLDPEKPALPDTPVTPDPPAPSGGGTGGGSDPVGETWHGTATGDTHTGATSYGDTIDGGNGGADYLVGGGPSITSGDADTIFAGIASVKSNGVYAESAKTPLSDVHYNADFLTTFNGDAALVAGTADRTHTGTDSGTWLKDNALAIFNNATILEGRAGDDQLVASQAKDVFLYQTGGGVGGLDLELSPSQLGVDTIHSFQVVTDVKTVGDAIFVMDQSAKSGGHTAIDQAFSAGWTIAETTDPVASSTATGHHDMVATIQNCGDGGNKTNGAVTLDWTSADYTSATLTIKGSTFATANAGDLTINLKGIQGADANTTIAELFGGTHNAGTDDIVWHGTKGNDVILGGSGSDTITGGTGGADYLAGGNTTDTSGDTIFAGTRTASNGTVYAESYKDAVSGYNLRFLGKTSNDSGFNGSDEIIDGIATPRWLSEEALAVFKDSTILEGRKGADVLVASNQKDVFLYQADGGVLGSSLELTPGDLGKDTIHQFELGVDQLFVLDHSGKHNGVLGDESYSAGWTFTGGSFNSSTATYSIIATTETATGADNAVAARTGTITMKFNGAGSYTLTIDHKLFEAHKGEGDSTHTNDLVIDFLGLQGVVDSADDIASLF